MGDNITLNINGKEVIIPDRSEDKWKEMAINLWNYLYPSGSWFCYVKCFNSTSTWKEDAIKLYEQAMKGV